MFRHVHPGFVFLGASVAIFAGLLALLYWGNGPGPHAGEGQPLYVYCAESLRQPMEAIQRDYERELGQPVILHFGASQTILTNLELSQKGDLFLPADESYIKLAHDRKLVSDTLPLAQMQAVVITRPDLPRKISSWDDLLAPGLRLGLANTEAAAIGKLVKAHLEHLGLWPALAKTQPKYQTKVNEVVNAALLGSIDAGIVWDAVAQPHSTRLGIVRLPELDGVTARVQIALARTSTQPADALRLARYIRAKDKGARYFIAQGFTAVEEGESSAKRPELVVYAGSMLRPAVEETLNEFEKREGVRIIRVYNGCGILVSQMKTGQRPDLYIACDPRFMTQVQDLFAEPLTISKNQLVIAVPKGNPRDIKKLSDLGQKDLRLGIGHEQQCALGAITKETFLRTGVYAQVARNVKVQSPTGDLLINQLRTGALDAVVAYRSNVIPFGDELDGIPVTGIDCAEPQQPVAVGKNSAHPELTRKLVEVLRSAESRERFEKLGFGWEIKDAATKD